MTARIPITDNYFQTFYDSFSHGTASTFANTVGPTYDCAVAGRPYLIDRTQQGDFRHRLESLPLIQRNYTFNQQNGLVSERSLNAEDYWRRSRESAHLGAGQTYFDREHSDPARYRTSKGIDPWTAGEIKLLNGVSHRFTSANSDLYLTTTLAHLYFLDGNALKYVADVTPGVVTAPTTVTADGTSGALSSPTSITSDGTHVWTVDGTRTNFTTDAGATFGKYHTSDHAASVVRVAKGRLLTVGASSAANIIYTHTMTFANDGVATALYTHPNPAWTWTDICGGPNAIYFVGHAGDRSAVYFTAIQQDGTNLAIPKVGADLPNGEVATSIYAYLSVLVIGTSKGLRIASMGSDGSLQLGDLIELDFTPAVFDGQDRFVWFGWQNYDDTSTGLGRLDLSQFNGTTPAYASDLMTTAQGAVQGVVTYGGFTVFSVDGSGIWVGDPDTYVTQGTLTSGWFNFGLVESKTYIKTTVSFRSGDGTFTVGLALDGENTFTQSGPLIDTTTSLEEVTLPAGEQEGRDFELELTVFSGGLDHDTTPVIARVTGMSNPAPERRLRWIVPLYLAARVGNRSGADHTVDVPFERDVLNALWQNNHVTTFQEPGVTWSVTIDDVLWLPYEPTGPGVAPEDGTMVVTMKVVT